VAEVTFQGGPPPAEGEKSTVLSLDYYSGETPWGKRGEKNSLQSSSPNSIEAK